MAVLKEVELHVFDGTRFVGVYKPGVLSQQGTETIKERIIMNYKDFNKALEDSKSLNEYFDSIALQSEGEVEDMSEFSIARDQGEKENTGTGFDRLDKELEKIKKVTTDSMEVLEEVYAVNAAISAGDILGMIDQYGFSGVDTDGDLFETDEEISKQQQDVMKYERRISVNNKPSFNHEDDLVTTWNLAKKIATEYNLNLEKTYNTLKDFKKKGYTTEKVIDLYNEWFHFQTRPSHDEVLKEMSELYARKNADYGDAFSKSMDADGLLVAKIRMGDKFGRFANLVSKNIDGEVDDETLRDTLIDLANYSVMTIMWMDSKK